MTLHIYEESMLMTSDSAQRTIYEKGELPSMAIPDASGANIPSDDEEEENDLDGFL